MSRLGVVRREDEPTRRRTTDHPTRTLHGMTSPVPVEGPTSEPQMVDWTFAVSIGSLLAGEGPTATRAEADGAVAELRAGAARSTGLVRDFTGLDAPEGTAPVLVVDRPGWVRANAEGFKAATAPMMR